MLDDDEVLEVVVPVEADSVDSVALGKTIWSEITAGVGIWGAFRPLIAVVLSLVPFLFLGQHFNRNHRRGADWFLLQIPLAFTLVLWVLLYLWSIIVAWRDASIIVSANS
jgi:phosphoglycerol transferase MdoB-like AlkP superfamily enzyme|tara:strand:+ start:419 stop:748 length:330 start_codon:yes stop_codon:yes gene_type:complete